MGTYRLLRSLPPTWMTWRRSLLPRLNSKLLSMTLLLEVWLPNRLPPLSMSFLLSLLLWLLLLLLLQLLLLSLLPTHSMLVSPLMAWDMLAFPTLALGWVTTVLASPTLDSLWFLLLLLLWRNEHFFLFSFPFWFSNHIHLELYFKSKFH